MSISGNQAKYLNITYLPLFMSIKGLFSRVCVTFGFQFLLILAQFNAPGQLCFFYSNISLKYEEGLTTTAPCKRKYEMCFTKARSPWPEFYAKWRSSSEHPLERHREKISLCSKDLAHWHNPQSCFISEDESFKSWWSGKRMLFSSCTKWTWANVKPNEFLKNGTAGITKAEN